VASSEVRDVVTAFGKLKLFMTGVGLFTFLVLAPVTAQPRTVPLHDPTLLNIGINCRWESRCMRLQRKAMHHALTYISKAKPPTLRIQRCNRNAARGRSRIDWVGFDHCIRNGKMGR
jgi:hypothetical protein